MCVSVQERFFASLARASVARCERFSVEVGSPETRRLAGFEILDGRTSSSFVPPSTRLFERADSD